MKQRLGLAAALLQPRRLLVLDEPTNGLDPQGMREIRSLVRELAVDGTTVFLSSHLLDEIEQVCTHAAVMAQGRLITQGPVAELAAGARGRLMVTTPDAADAARVLKEQGVGDVVVTEDRDRVTGEAPDRRPRTRRSERRVGRRGRPRPGLRRRTGLPGGRVRGADGGGLRCRRLRRAPRRGAGTARQATPTVAAERPSRHSLPQRTSHHLPSLAHPRTARRTRGRTDPRRHRGQDRDGRRFRRRARRRRRPRVHLADQQQRSVPGLHGTRRDPPLLPPDGHRRHRGRRDRRRVERRHAALSAGRPGRPHPPAAHQVRDRR